MIGNIYSIILAVFIWFSTGATCLSYENMHSNNNMHVKNYYIDDSSHNICRHVVTRYIGHTIKMHVVAYTPEVHVLTRYMGHTIVIPVVTPYMGQRILHM